MENKTIHRLPNAKTFLMDQIIQIRAHQVMSLTAYADESDSFLLFSYDTGEGVSREILQEDSLYYVLDGEMEILVGSKKFYLHRGECIVIKEGEPHAMVANSPSKLFALHAGYNNLNKEINMEFIKNMPKSEVLSLKTLVDREENQVSSLSIVQKENFTVTVFAFDTGTHIGPHICEGDAMVTILEGSATVEIDGKDFIVKEKESIVMPADFPHAVKASNEPFKMLLIVVKP